MSDGMIEGFQSRRLAGDGVELDVLVGGNGPPLLLLHGYPQTRLCWKRVAPLLAESFTLVIPDLRGYGRSDKPKSDPQHATYSKRTMARDQLATMKALGFERFFLAGHDRGGRVAYRLALDHPHAVQKLATLDIVPTAEVWKAATAESAMKQYHWYFLAQPFPLPETLIGSDPDFFLRYKLKSWAAEGFHFDEESVQDYVACFSSDAAIHATCEDYRAGYTCDRAADEADRGKKKIEVPMLALWGEEGSVQKASPLDKWAPWASDLRGHAVKSGHFMPEEAPEEVASALEKFFLST